MEELTNWEGLITAVKDLKLYIASRNYEEAYRLAQDIEDELVKMAIKNANQDLPSQD